MRAREGLRAAAICELEEFLKLHLDSNRVPRRAQIDRTTPRTVRLTIPLKFSLS